MEEKGFENEKVLQDNQKYFNFYLILPRIVTIILGVLFFIAGLCMFGSSGMFARIFVLPTWIAGAIVCVLTYYLMKVVLSYNILNIYYLKKIAEKGEEKKEEINKDENV